METVEYTLKTVNQEKKITISKVTGVKLGKGKEFIHLDRLKDGTWRMVYTEGTLTEYENIN